MHPSPYFRPELMRNNSQYNDRLEDPIGATLTGPRHPPPPPPLQMLDPSNTPQHMDYIYNSYPNHIVHPEYNMVRGSRLPLDISQTNLMGPPVYSSYDPAFVQYRNEMERISQPFTDPYSQLNMHVPPFNPGFLPLRPTAPGVYRYINPQHVQPVWIYPHMLER